VSGSGTRELPIIDAHIHLYRDIEKEKQALPIPGRRDRDRWGNVDSIFNYMDREGVSHAVALNLYPTGLMRRILRSKIPASLPEGEKQAAEHEVERELGAGLRRQNDWLCRVSQASARIVAGIGVQKLLSPEELVAEVELRAAQGARTVKLIPGWFREFPNDRAFWPMYRRCEELGLAVTADTGALGLGEHMSHPGEQNRICYGEPVNFTEVLEEFPRLTVVMCHFPSAFWDQRVELARRFPQLVFDISGGFAAPSFHARDGKRALPESDAVRVMRKVGIERMMFGSDGPHVMLQPCLEQFLRLDLADAERQLVLVDNAKRVYRIS
jgi:predicted TIM-barrel fold metal-dependent hydrolase